MQYLADDGFHVIPLHQAVVAIQHHSALPSRPVVLTFDDGYADFFTTAIPILQSHGFTATSFVISGRMGWGGYMTPSQIVAAALASPSARTPSTTSPSPPRRRFGRPGR